MRFATLALLALTAAQPALASRNLEGLVVNSFLQRCVTPMAAGGLPDLKGLTIPQGSPELGKPGGEIQVSNVDGPMGLRVQTLPAGPTSCAMSLELAKGFDVAQVNTALAGHLQQLAFRPVTGCDSDTIKAMQAFEGPATPEGRRLGILSFVIVLGDLLPDQLSLIAAESDQPLPSDTNCANPAGGPQ